MQPPFPLETPLHYPLRPFSMYNMYTPFAVQPPPSSLLHPFAAQQPPPFLPPNAPSNPTASFPAPTPVPTMRPPTIPPLPPSHPHAHRSPLAAAAAASKPASLSIAARAAARYHVEPRARPKPFFVNVRYEDAPQGHLLVRDGGVEVAVSLQRRALRAWYPLHSSFPELATPDVRLRNFVESSSETGLDVVRISVNDSLELVWSPHRAANFLVFVLAAPPRGARRLKVGGIGFQGMGAGDPSLRGAGRAWWLPQPVDDKRFLLPPSPGAGGGHARVGFDDDDKVYPIISEWDMMSVAEEEASVQRIASVEAVVPSTPEEAVQKEGVLHDLRREHALRSPRERQLRDPILPGSPQSTVRDGINIADSPAFSRRQQPFMGGGFGGNAMYGARGAGMGGPYGRPPMQSFAHIPPMNFR